MRASNRTLMTLILAPCTVAIAQETTVQNDTLIGGSGGNIQAGFVAGESAAAWLTSPCDGNIVAVQVFWRSFLGGAPQSIEDSITIFDAGSFPTPGGVLLTEFGQLAEIIGPVMTDGVINEFRFLDENMTQPLSVPILTNDAFVVSFKFLNSPTAFTPSVVTDTNGCQSGRNGVFAVPGGWFDACLLGVTGDFVIRAVVDCNPTQACCFDADSCVDLTEDDCMTASGFPQGAGTDCDTVDCFPEGACCMADGTCADLSPEDCASMSGSYQGNGTECALVKCVQPSGACCLSNGNCLFLPEADCTAIPNANWAGFGTDCSDGDMNMTADACETGFCGDGTIDAGAGEECDDGSANSDTTPDACRTDCTLPICGDGVTDTSEDCDDGNTKDFDGCSSICIHETIFETSCTRDCDCYFNAVDNGDPFDVCDYHYCDREICTSCTRRYGNTCASFGGFVQTSDILCAVTGFGNYCACPNADFIAPGGTKGPSGSPIGTDDVLAIVGAFGGENPFDCPVPDPATCDDTPPLTAMGCGPTAANEWDENAMLDGIMSEPVAPFTTATLTIQPRTRTVYPGGAMEVDIFVTNVSGLAGYEFGLAAIDSDNRAIQNPYVYVQTQRRDYVFSGLPAFPAFDTELLRIGGVVMDAGVTTAMGEHAYLGTFIFQVPDETRGTITIKSVAEFTALYSHLGQQRIHPVAEATVIIAAPSRR